MACARPPPLPTHPRCGRPAPRQSRLSPSTHPAAAARAGTAGALAGAENSRCRQIGSRGRWRVREQVQRAPLARQCPRHSSAAAHSAAPTRVVAPGGAAALRPRADDQLGVGGGGPAALLLAQGRRTEQAVAVVAEAQAARRVPLAPLAVHSCRGQGAALLAGGAAVQRLRGRRRAAAGPAHRRRGCRRAAPPRCRRTPREAPAARAASEQTCRAAGGSLWDQPLAGRGAAASSRRPAGPRPSCNLGAAACPHGPLNALWLLKTHSALAVATVGSREAHPKHVGWGFAQQRRARQE